MIASIATLSRTAKATLTRQAVMTKTLNNLWIDTEKKISWLVSSEIQCTQRCLAMNGCFLINYNFKSERIFLFLWAFLSKNILNGTQKSPSPKLQLSNSSYTYVSITTKIIIWSCTWRSYLSPITNWKFHLSSDQKSRYATQVLLYYHFWKQLLHQFLFVSQRGNAVTLHARDFWPHCLKWATHRLHTTKLLVSGYIYQSLDVFSGFRCQFVKSAQ